MKKSILIGILLLFYVTGWAQSGITTFILVRHAEKISDGSDDPDLRPEGLQRAKDLVTLLDRSKVDAIYSTSFKRTRNTIVPLAEAKKLQVLSYDAFKAAPIEQMLKEHRGGTVVICGHSNNIPWIANFLTGDKQVADYDDTDYGNILIVSVVAPGQARVTWLRY